jgi:hypothetical protein
MADAEPTAPVPVEAPKPQKKRSPNRLVVEEAMNDDNSVPSPAAGFKTPIALQQAYAAYAVSVKSWAWVVGGMQGIDK